MCKTLHFFCTFLPLSRRDIAFWPCLKTKSCFGCSVSLKTWIGWYATWCMKLMNGQHTKLHAKLHAKRHMNVHQFILCGQTIVCVPTGAVMHQNVPNTHWEQSRLSKMTSMMNNVTPWIVMPVLEPVQTVVLEINTRTCQTVRFGETKRISNPAVAQLWK